MSAPPPGTLSVCLGLMMSEQELLVTVGGKYTYTLLCQWEGFKEKHRVGRLGNYLPYFAFI